MKARRIIGSNVSTETNKKNSAPRRPVITIKDISNIFDELDISSGDTLLVHSGISNIGKIAGGPKALYDSLRERVGPEGNLFFPTFPFNTLAKTYLSTKPTFDVRNSGSKMGSLSSIALSDPARFRSMHPTHSVCGTGPDVKDFLENHHLDHTPFGERSPFAKLVEKNGKILLLGVGLPSVTSFHLTEDVLSDEYPVKVYLEKNYNITCIDENGNKHLVKTPSHDPFISRLRDCNLVHMTFCERGIYRFLPLGNDHIAVLNAAAMHEGLMQMLNEKKQTIYGRIW